VTVEYRVVEAGATEPDDLQDWLNAQAAEGWRCVGVTTVPATSVTVKTGGGFFSAERDTFRGFTSDGWGSETYRSKHVYNIWVTLERERPADAE
jgi:Domain of unknown function (DUF4177)